MRTIKFRAWNGEQMISPDYIDRKGVAHWKENSIPTSSDKVMQFTGLLDKNGKEIYEGDVVMFYDVYSKTLKRTPTKGEIYYNHLMCGFNVKTERPEGLFWPPSSNCEVIGNIYENN